MNDYTETPQEDVASDEGVKGKDLASKHDFFMRDFDDIIGVMQPEREQCVEDRRFYSIAGAQWEGSLGDQFANKLRFEMNKIHRAIIRIFNEYRNNRIGIEFSPKAGEDGDEYDALAEACAGLFRADSQDSNAEEATDNAFEEAVGGGFGAFRLCNEYEDDSEELEEGEERKQRIRIRPIYDADSCVFYDLNAKRQDKADARRCYVLTSMSINDFKNEYGEDPASWPHDVAERGFDWVTPNDVYVAQIYEVEYVEKTLHVYKGVIDGETKAFDDADITEDPTIVDEDIAKGYVFSHKKTIKRRRVHKYIASGARIMEDCGHIAGAHIPVIPVYGKRWFVDNIERCMGHTRLSKDGQRLYNMQISKLGQFSAASSYKKPIVTPEQIAGHQTMWENDPVKDYTYLLLNPMTDESGNQIASGPIAYTSPPEVPPALAALLQITSADLREILGDQQQGEAIVSNIATETVELLSQRIDMQTFIYMSNMAKAMQRAGEVWLSMASDTYVEEGRKMKTVGPSGEVSSLEIMRPTTTEETDNVVYANNLRKAKFDVIADVGPSSSSKRAATVRTVRELLAITADPADQQVLSAMILMNIEGEGVGDARDYYRKKLIKLGVVNPTKEEQQALADELANQLPDPNAEYLQAAAKQAEAEATAANADTILTLAKADESHAKFLEILSGISQEEQQIAISAAKAAVDASRASAQQAPAQVTTPEVQAP